MLSYWEQESFLAYNHIIIGAGIVGLSVSIEFALRYPNQKILILERGWLPSGASTRNAGFACMGSASELLEDLNLMSETAVFSLFEKRKKGLEKLCSRLGVATIGFRQQGSYELIKQEDLSIIDQLDYLNQLLFPIANKKAFIPSNKKLTEFGFSSEIAQGLIENTCEGELHTGKMMKALWSCALEHHVEIKTGVEVARYEEDSHHIAVIINDPIRNEEIALKARSVCICTNGFTKNLVAEEPVVPGRGQVMITDPIPSLPFKGIFHFDKGYYYFREIDGRVLLGGGRNLDVDGETTTDLSLHQPIQQHLENLLRTYILPNHQFNIAQRWSGIMAFGGDKLPIVKALSPRVFGAFKMGGMGVALGSLVAEELASLHQNYS